jgi:dinuclear metal center YbgI/SA1388 family protein
MKLKDLCSYLDSEIPLTFQESYDNSGLQIGLPEREISSAILTLDVTDEVINEAIRKNADIVISHHPLIFSGIKKISDTTITEKLIHKCIRHDIAVYSAHTNLDVFPGGVSSKIAEKLMISGKKVLLPLENRLLKLVTFVPESHLDKVRNAVFDAGAGVIGNYDLCGYTVSGTGSFRGNDEANPFIGDKGIMSFEKEVRFETILTKKLPMIFTGLRIIM